MFNNDVTPTDCAWEGGIKWWPVNWILAVLEFRNDDISLESRFALAQVSTHELLGYEKD
jgi:hypothetical protein